MNSSNNSTNSILKKYEIFLSEIPFNFHWSIKKLVLTAHSDKIHSARPKVCAPTLSSPILRSAAQEYQINSVSIANVGFPWGGIFFQTELNLPFNPAHECELLLLNSGRVRERCVCVCGKFPRHWSCKGMSPPDQSAVALRAPILWSLPGAWRLFFLPRRARTKNSTQECRGARAICQGWNYFSLTVCCAKTFKGISLHMP